MRRVWNKSGLLCIVLAAMLALSGCQPPATDVKGSGQGNIVESVLNSAHTMFRFEGLEWNMSSQDVFKAMKLTENDFDKDKVYEIYTRKLPVVFDRPGVEATVSLTFADNLFKKGEYAITVASMDELVLVCGEFRKQLETYICGNSDHFGDIGKDLGEFLGESRVRGIGYSAPVAAPKIVDEEGNDMYLHVPYPSSGTAPYKLYFRVQVTPPKRVVSGG